MYFSVLLKKIWRRHEYIVQRSIDSKLYVHIYQHQKKLINNFKWTREIPCNNCLNTKTSSPKKFVAYQAIATLTLALHN